MRRWEDSEEYSNGTESDTHADNQQYIQADMKQDNKNVTVSNGSVCVLFASFIRLADVYFCADNSDCMLNGPIVEIGRASYRERVCMLV